MGTSSAPARAASVSSDGDALSFSSWLRYPMLRPVRSATAARVRRRSTRRRRICVGKALGTSLVRAGHRVTLTANNAQHATDAAAEIGASASVSNAEAARDADVVILAAPYAVVRDEIAPQIVDAARGHVVIDATNPLTATAKQAVLDLVASVGLTPLDVGP